MTSRHEITLFSIVLLCSSAVSAWTVPALADGSNPAAEVPTASDRQTLTIVVMDPLCAPLSCPCVEGYAQRDYEKLAAYLQKSLDQPVKVIFNESLVKALESDKSIRADLIIGKDSVVRSDARAAKLKLTPIAHLTGKDGKTTQTGLIVVPKDDPAQAVSDLNGYRILFGPADCAEKFDAPQQLLKKHGVSIPDKLETSAACSDGASKILEFGDDVRAAAVISSYAQPLLEGCGTIDKGSLRVVGETGPVAFITVFAARSLSDGTSRGLQQALLNVSQDRSLCQALESAKGFVAPATTTIVVSKKRVSPGTT
jgi:ABC-type phosphate/phosphonate transport system substrate-binding protein